MQQFQVVPVLPAGREAASAQRSQRGGNKGKSDKTFPPSLHEPRLCLPAQLPWTGVSWEVDKFHWKGEKSALVTLNQWSGAGASPHQQPGLGSPRDRQWLGREKSFAKGIPCIHVPTQSTEFPVPSERGESPKSGTGPRLTPVSLSRHSTTGMRERKIPKELEHRYSLGWT